MAGVLSKYVGERGSRTTLKNTFIGFSSLGLVLYLLRLYLSSKKQRKYLLTKSSESKKDKILVDAEFFKRLKKLSPILIPKLLSAESGLIVLIAVTLVLRSVCDVWVIKNATDIESAIIGGKRGDFRMHIFSYISAMPFMSLVNNTLKIGINKLKLRFRANLTVYLFDLYFRDMVYYRVTQLDSRINNVDQLLTQDVEKFCDSIADVYTNLSKPVLDVLLYLQRISATVGFRVPALMLSYLGVSGLLLTYLRRPLGQMTVTEQALEGEYRFVNSRLIMCSEEVAFYNGNEREKMTMSEAFFGLVSHLQNLIQFKFSMGFIDNIIAKYMATCVGFSLVSIPFLDKTNYLASSTHGERLESYYRAGRMMVRLAQAIGRLVLAGREMTKLAGFTSRVTLLINTLTNVAQGHYERATIDTDRLGRGTLNIEDNIIKFERVPLITPNRDILIPELTFEVKSGENLLVCGPNGCGKSSLFRILGELWPFFGGTLTKPESGKLFYIPQKPYMTLGTLRDQIIYPDCKQYMTCDDEKLKEYLDLVHLKYILAREGDWDSRKDWADILSGGEKQRIAMARVFYHKPQFAILDECTSAVSMDVEDFMYSYCRQIGITLITVSHRKSLWKHHDFYLHMDGRGSYMFKPIAEDTFQFGS